MALPKTYAEARWALDLDPSGVETASDLESLENDVLHILIQTLGSNLADPGKGLGVVNYLGGTTEQLGQLPSIVDAQLAQVSRIASSVSTLSAMDGGWLLAIALGVAGQIVNLKFALTPDGVAKA